MKIKVVSNGYLCQRQRIEGCEDALN